MQKINLDELKLKACSLRENIPCEVVAPNYDDDARYSMMGGMNIHIRIHFKDGVSWIARIRRFNATSPPPDLRDHIIRSEVATLLFLAETTIPTPEMRGYALEGKDNSVGVGYILMDNMPGKVLNWGSTPAEGRMRVIDQLADFYIELHRFSFDKMGCMDQPGTRHVGAFARECLTNFAQSEMQPLGPFTNLQDYYKASIGLLLDLIHRQEIFTDKTVEAYLIYKFLLEKVPEVYPKRLGDPKAFYLTHADDKGDHILVDEEFNITAIIDWEWAYITSETLAFNSPMLLLPVSDFFDGVDSIGEEEELFAQTLERKGASGIAEIVRNGRLHHQFAFCCTFDLGFSFEDLLGLFKGLRSTTEIDHRWDWEEWKEFALERYNQDDRLKEILKP